MRSSSVPDKVHVAFFLWCTFINQLLVWSKLYVLNGYCRGSQASKLPRTVLDEVALLLAVETGLLVVIECMDAKLILDH